MDFAVDVSDVTKLANQTKGAPRIVNEELNRAGRQSGMLMESTAKQLAAVGEGHMRSTIGPPQVRNLNPGVEVLLGVSAQSAEGFPYPVAIEFGRGPVVPRRAKVLRFVVGGAVVFTRRAGPARAQPFMRPALERNTARFVAFFQQAGDRIARRVLGAG